MDIIYTENAEWTLPYWLDLDLEIKDDDLMRIMDINQWAANLCGELGTKWGYERKQIVLQHPPGLNPVKVRIFYTRIHYSWRFKDKADAMMFKLRWGGK